MAMAMEASFVVRQSSPRSPPPRQSRLRPPYRGATPAVLVVMTHVETKSREKSQRSQNKTRALVPQGNLRVVLSEVRRAVPHHVLLQHVRSAVMAGTMRGRSWHAMCALQQLRYARHREECAIWTPQRHGGPMPAKDDRSRMVSGFRRRGRVGVCRYCHQ